MLPPDFDPDGPARPGRAFGLPHALNEAAVRVLPLPWDATASSGTGTAGGPAAILEATAQVDLHDRRWGEAWRAGIAWGEAPAFLADLAPRALAAADRARAGDAVALAFVNEAGARVHDAVAAWVAAELDAGAIPAVVGGDHSVASGAIAAAARSPIGVLHVDAHADLRVAYEGFAYSHASVMDHALAASPDLVLSSIGLRDLGHAERDRIATDPRVHAVFDDRFADAAGGPWGHLLDEAIRPLPPAVWVSFDVDGLDPSLCPGTGTPVPGGLSWHQATALLARLVHSGRRIVGFDLCEVAPAPWDAAVGARLLHQLACAAITSHAPGAPHGRS
jgi:agmatinase